MKITKNDRVKPAEKNSKLSCFLVLITVVTLCCVLTTQTFSVYYVYNKIEALKQDQLVKQIEFKSEIQNLFQKELKQVLVQELDGKFANNVGPKKQLEEPPKPSLNLFQDIWSEPEQTEEAPEVASRAKRASLRTRRMPEDQDYEDEDQLSLQLQGQPNQDTTDKSWLQLTSYARIPYNAIQEFCLRTRDSCPAGPEGQRGYQGDIGITGSKGDRGDRGLPGQQGLRGLRGPSGMIGPPGKNGRKGEIGPSGKNGVDGRDGLPGEPGLDGIPGRNGLDGMAGIDGIPGYGRPGRDGRHGHDGKEGLKGSPGLQGHTGPMGLTGPRGRPGSDGSPGTAGLPGISTWRVNGTTVNKLLIPPSIPGTNGKTHSLIVRENDHVRLRCEAAGNPRPLVEWSRQDGGVIATGQWKDGSVTGDILNLTHIRRDHTGTYRCDASNGVPPDAHKTYDVEVHFDPNIRTNQWKVGAENGTNTLLECHVEAFPIAVLYWEDQRGRLLESTRKHRIRFEQNKDFIWKSKMTLAIRNVSKMDFGDYYCVAKNDLSTTRGLVKLYEMDPSRQIPATGSIDGLSFGPDPPRYSELFNDLCPPPVHCPTCPEPEKKVGRSSLYCLQVTPYGNDTYPGYKNRTRECLLSAVGKAVYHRYTKSAFGSWMQDPVPRDRKTENYFWTTTPTHPTHLYEYDDKIHYRKDIPSHNYSLPVPFTGNSHVVYNGSFFYQKRDSSQIIRYDMARGTVSSLHVPQLAANGTNFLYNEGMDFIDFATDDNGLWAIYGLAQNNNTVVMKIDPWVLKVEYSWNISISNHKFGEMFITCGVLYGIDSASEKQTKIRFALDLYEKKLLDVDLQFSNPFGKTTMLGYNHKAEEIYSWDDGNQLTYPVKYISIGYNSPYDESKN